MSVLTADVQDRDGGCWLPAAARRHLPRVREVIADRGFSRRFRESVRRALGWRVAVTVEPPAGFAVQPGGGWSSGRPGGWWRTAGLRVEYECHPETSEAVVQAAMTDLMLRRLHPTE